MLKINKINILVLAGIGIAAIAGIPGYGAAKADATATPKVGAYEALSAGNKKIAEALFNGQIATADGKEPLNLDQIAAAKKRDGWGRIFKQLRADGLLDAKNLRELTSGRYQQQFSRKTSTGGAVKSTVVTTASGRQIIVDKNSLAHQGGRNTGRDKNRRGSKSIGQHTEGLFSSGSTYRGRDNSAQSGGAASIGITSASGVATTNIITR